MTGCMTRNMFYQNIIPDDILINYLTTDQIAAFKNGATGIFSVTVFAKKPMAEKCVPGGGCC